MEVKIKNKIVLIDEENYNDLINNSWSFDNNGYLSNRRLELNDRFHRYIMRDEINKFSIENNLTKRQVKIDHINQNKLDNRKCNLRCVTHSDNLMNRPKQKNNSSGYKGISITQPNITKYYDVSLKYKGVRYRKIFKRLEDAIEYRKQLIKELNILEF